MKYQTKLLTQIVKFYLFDMENKHIRAHIMKLK